MNDRGIEIHEQQVIEGDFPDDKPRYTAHAMVQVQSNQGAESCPMAVPIFASDYREAFEKADGELNKEFEAIKKEIQEAQSGPSIIKPEGT